MNMKREYIQTWLDVKKGATYGVQWILTQLSQVCTIILSFSENYKRRENLPFLSFVPELSTEYHLSSACKVEFSNID